jgi:hypothetical protein
MHLNGDLQPSCGVMGVLQYLELTGFCQYIRWLPQNFVEAETDNMTLGFFHRWLFFTSQAI